jgi:pyruvate,water dikinase
LTPFSASVLGEMAGRSWYSYYDRLGFDPTPRARVVRHLHGRPYFTLTLSAQLEAQQAGSEPPALRVNGGVRPLARWEKPGLLAGLKLGGNARKLAAVLLALAGELAAAETKGRAWLQRVQAMRWSQAEILQIMEEIERIGAETLQLYVAARQHLEFAYLRLLALLEGPATPQQLAHISAALRPGGELVEVALGREVAALAQAAAGEPEVRALLAAGDYAAVAAGQGGAFAENLARVLAAYGHRCAGEGELLHARWAEDPAPLLAAVAAAAETGGALPAPLGPDEGLLLAQIDGKRRKEAQALLQTARQALILQSRALHVHAYTLAGTRIWALAAGREAMSDGRLPAVDDIFFYELEEAKEMMTGEWNISDLAGIHATAAERRAEWQRSQATIAGDLLIGDSEAFAPAWAAAGPDAGLLRLPGDNCV